MFGAARWPVTQALEITRARMIKAGILSFPGILV